MGGFVGLYRCPLAIVNATTPPACFCAFLPVTWRFGCITCLTTTWRWYRTPVISSGVQTAVLVAVKEDGYGWLPWLLPLLPKFPHSIPSHQTAHSHGYLHLLYRYTVLLFQPPLSSPQPLQRHWLFWFVAWRLPGNVTAVCRDSGP